MKTCQINYPVLYKIKTDSLSYIEKNNSDIDKKFIKSLMRHDYLGNIYCLILKIILVMLN